MRNKCLLGLGLVFVISLTSMVVFAFSFIVCGTHPKRATLGTIIEVRCEQDVNALIAAFESSKTGTIRIG